MFILEAWIKELPTFTKWGLKYKLKKEYNLELSDYALIMNKRKEHFSIYKDKNNIPVYIYIIISMIEHIKKNIRQDYYWLIEKNIDRISDYLLRYIKRKGSKYVGKDFFLYAIIRDLEKLGDFYRDFCKILLKKNNLSSELINALENVNKYFNQFYELFYSKSDQIDFMYKDYKNVSKKLAQISINNSNFELIHLLKEIMYTIEHLIGPYYEYAFIENSS